MKYFIIAGEASGDLHGSNLLKSIKKNDVQAEFMIIGGDLMQAQGGKLLKHYREMAFMGLVDVVMNIRTIGKNMKMCKKQISEWNPDVVILIDYAGFNLRIAEFAKANGYKVFFYIAPKVWAWQESRVKKLKAHVDKLFVIFPFEVEYFKKHGIEAEYFGNPLKDEIAEFRKKGDDYQAFINRNNLTEKPIIALLAGSRKHEVTRCLPEMLEAVKNQNNYQLVIAAASAIPESIYQEIIKSYPVTVIYNQTYNILNHAHSAVVTSGTATLETALFKVPEVVVFKTGPLTYFIGKMIVKIKFFSLVNIILDKEVVKELLQENLATDIATEMKKILNDQNYRSKMIEDYNTIDNMLGESGVSDRIANKMAEILK
jgi:lipid-A-disaccharide synthase